MGDTVDVVAQMERVLTAISTTSPSPRIMSNIPASKDIALAYQSYEVLRGNYPWLIHGKVDDLVLNCSQYADGAELL